MTEGASSGREHDIVVFGATGFVGRLVADYLAGAAPPETRIALAGRSAERLAKVRASLPGTAASWPTVVADSSDAASMARLAASTTTVATTVGPYARYGLPLVEACAAAGTHYADLTGEVLFVRESIDRYHGAAEASGARIVHACGYDSIPSDLGVLLLHEEVTATGVGALGPTVLVARARGGFSGGTIDSLRYQLATQSAEPERSAVVGDPYTLSPERSSEPDGADETDPTTGRFEADLGGWLAPFVMAPYNTRIVRRSNALSGWSYGRALRYQEYMATGQGAVGALGAHGIGLGMRAFMAGMSHGATRAVLDRVLPDPGAGPNEATRRKGWFRSEIFTTTTSGARRRAVVAGTGDPGYAATAVMLGQTALCLASDGDDLPDMAGVLTPATAMAGALVGRLRSAGLRLEVVDDQPG